MARNAMYITSSQKSIVHIKARGRCAYCGVKLEFAEMVIMHKIPLSRGGTNKTRNLIPTCLPCSEIEYSMTPWELRRKRKRLRTQHKKRIKSMTMKQKILDKTNGFCAYCGAELTLESMTVDHIVSIYNGGENDWDNLVPACWNCNHLKGTLTFDEFNSIRKNRSESAAAKLVVFFRTILFAFQRLFHFGR